MKLSNLKLFYLSQSMAYVYFWISIAVPYLMYRGLTSVEVFSLMSIYQFSGVILEYPTGVIGDKFGHKKVTYVSNTLNFLAMVMLSFTGSYMYYALCLLILALGNGFSSGNDMGMLKSVSNNIKKDTANHSSLMELIIFFSAVAGGYVSQALGYEQALLISGAIMLLANVPLYFMNKGVTHVKSQEKIWSIVLDGFRTLKNYQIRKIFVLIPIFGGFAFSVKSIIGSFGDVYQIDISQIGWIIGLGGLARSIGSKLYAELEIQNITYSSMFVALAIFAIGMQSNYKIVVSLLMFSQLLFGYILSKLDGDVHELASDQIRASLFSLKRLLIRLVASSYLAIYGYMVGINQFSLLMYLTSLVMFLAILYYMGVFGNTSKQTTKRR